MMANDEVPSIGDNNTYVGEGPMPSMGDGNTIYTAADANGSVILSKGGTAIGAGARADSTSVAIGAGALGGDLPRLLELLDRLQRSLDDESAAAAAQALAELRGELQSPSPNLSKLSRLWMVVKAAATTNEAITLVAHVGPLLFR